MQSGLGRQGYGELGRKGYGGLDRQGFAVLGMARHAYTERTRQE
jgi:hypothetical protein